MLRYYYLKELSIIFPVNFLFLFLSFSIINQTLWDKNNTQEFCWGNTLVKYFLSVFRLNAPLWRTCRNACGSPACNGGRVCFNIGWNMVCIGTVLIWSWQSLPCGCGWGKPSGHRYGWNWNTTVKDRLPRLLARSRFNRKRDELKPRPFLLQLLKVSHTSRHLVQNLGSSRREKCSSFCREKQKKRVLEE